MHYFAASRPSWITLDPAANHDQEHFIFKWQPHNCTDITMLQNYTKQNLLNNNLCKVRYHDLVFNPCCSVSLSIKLLQPLCMIQSIVHPSIKKQSLAKLTKIMHIDFVLNLPWHEFTPSPPLQQNIVMPSTMQPAEHITEYRVRIPTS